jgi:hypothetical protein
MSHSSHSQEPLPAFGTDDLSQIDFSKGHRDLINYRQTLLNLLQGLDANEVCPFPSRFFFDPV